MTAAECLAWSALVVSAVAALVWSLTALASRLGVALGATPAWTVLASVPVLTAASLWPLASPPWVEARPEAPTAAPGESAAPAFHGLSALTAGRPLLSEEEARKPIRPDDREPTATAPAPAIDWTALRDRAEGAFRAAAPWLAGVLLLGLAAGWLRLAVGWRAICRLARAGRPIDDAELRELVDVLRAELSLSGPVAVRECPALPSAAAVGWRRPAVLLPAGWRQWSGDERRAVLAHELAHVRRGDYLAWVVAQGCAAAHFFNPLVRGVSQWLRLEQERSADAAAARLAGGRREYLRVLAALAVRQRDVSAAWPARCFLPTRGSFVRRIEMLRSCPPRWSVRTAVGHSLSAACVVAVGLALSAFRPALAAPLQVEPDNPATAGAPSPIPVPQTAIAAGHVRVADALKHPHLGKFVADFVRSAPPFGGWGGPLPPELDRVGVVVLATDHVPDFDAAVILISRAPWDAKRLFGENRLHRSSHVEAGVTVFKESDQIVGLLLDPKTLVVPDRPHGGAKILRAMTGPRHEGLERLLARGGDATVTFATSGTELFGAVASKPNRGDELAAALIKPILEGQQSVLLRLDAGADLQARVEAEYSTPDGAKAAGKIAEAALTLLGNFVGGAAAAAPAGDPKGPILKFAKTALGSARVQVEGAKATATAQLAGAELAGPLAAAIKQAQEGNSRLVGANNLKQIGIAMHMYADIHKKLPAANAPEGEGKFPVSWRVRILPFIEQEALFREYRMDEPWDGPNNRKLLAKMPVVYRNPVKPSATDTPYQVLVGERTTFPPGRGVAFGEITDGTSRTLLVVETDPAVPWTKPEDVSFPFPGKPPLGGIHRGGYNVAMADGSVQFFSEHIDRNVLDAIVTRNGGEMVGGPAPPRTAKTPPPKQP